MSADLHIHVLAGIDEADLARFFASTLGSKYFAPATKFSFDNADKIHGTPHVHVGEVSWLKAAVFDAAETFIPDPVGRVYEIVGEELPVVDDDLIEKIHEAMTLDNDTEYSVATPEAVREFLVAHMGQRIFTVSW